MNRTISTQQFDYEVIPASKSVPRAQQRLMIVLHGRGDSLKLFRTINQELRLPQMNYLLLNAPRRYDTGYTWYAFPPNQKTGILLAREKITRLLLELELQGWPSHQIFFYGFSQGCLISCDIGLSYPKPLGGIIGISGYIYRFSDWRKRLPAAAFHTPWLLTHGHADDAIEIQQARLGARRLLNVGLPVDYVELDKGHDIDLEEEVPLIRNWIKSHLESPRVDRAITVVEQSSTIIQG